MQALPAMTNDTLILVLLGLVLVLLLLGVGSVLLALRTPLRLQRDLNESLRRIGEQEILTAQLRIQIERQHEALSQVTRYAQQSDQHLSEVYRGLFQLGPDTQATVLAKVTTPRPPPFRGGTDPAPRYIRAEVIRHM